MWWVVGEKNIFSSKVKDKARGTFRRIFRCPDVTELLFLGANFEYPVISPAAVGCKSCQNYLRLLSFINVSHWSRRAGDAVQHLQKDLQLNGDVGSL